MKNFLIALALIFGLIGLYKLTSRQPQVAGVSDADAQLVMYWGEGCPHCEKVKQYISDNNMESKVKIAYKEVYYNTANQQQLADTVKNCPEIDASQGIGVPLAYDKQNNKCLYGDEPIIQWLSQR